MYGIINHGETTALKTKRNVGHYKPWRDHNALKIKRNVRHCKPRRDHNAQLRPNEMYDMTNHGVTTALKTKRNVRIVNHMARP